MTTRSPLKTIASTAAAATFLVLAVAGCGGSSGKAETAPARFAGPQLTPAKPAAPLELRDSHGRRVNLEEDRGKAVLLTFIYTHCPDTCPLIVSHLRTALAELGPKAREARVIAVSTDPRGDTPANVDKFVKARGMAGKMEYLIGSRRELEKVWRAWGVAVEPGGGEAEGLVGHSALVYGIDGAGKVTTIYAANFKPAEIAHDVPLLASR